MVLVAFFFQATYIPDVILKLAILQSMRQSSASQSNNMT